MMNLIAFEQSLTNSEPSGFVLRLPSSRGVPGDEIADTPIDTGAQPFPVLPPITKKRKKGEDLANKSALKRNPGRCKACIANGVVPSDNHRSYSQKCPFFKRK
jgi:hypothetical protein